MLVRKTFNLKQASPDFAINTVTDMGIKAGIKRVKIYASGAATSADNSKKDQLFAPSGLIDYEFPMIDGKLPCTFSFHSGSSSTLTLVFMVEEIGGEPDVNYFNGTVKGNTQMAMSMSLLDEEPTMIKDISKDEIN